MTRKSQTTVAKTPTVASDFKLQSVQQKCTNITAEIRDEPAPSNKLERNTKLRKPESLSIRPGTGKSEKRPTRATKKPIPDSVLVRDKPAPNTNHQWNPTLRKPKSLSIQPGTSKSEKRPTRALKKPIPHDVVESISLPPGLQSSIASSDTKKVGPQKKNQPSVPKDSPAPDCLNSNPSTSTLRSTPEPTDIRKLSLRKQSL